MASTSVAHGFSDVTSTGTRGIQNDKQTAKEIDHVLVNTRWNVVPGTAV